MRVSPILTIAALVGIAVACADTPVAAPNPNGTVNLLSPAGGARFVQNDPALLECPDHPTRGRGFRLAFDWDDVEGADRYAIFLKQKHATYPAINYSVGESEFSGLWCNAFVLDRNLNDWLWRVAAIAHGADSLTGDTLWSEERIYGYEPCRLASGAPCSAPDSLTP